MRLEQLQYLIAISQSASLSAAAEKLYLTPQALSMSISSMEKELALTLLNRSYKGVSLTEDGKEIMEAAEKFLYALNKVQQRHAHQKLPTLTGTYELVTPFGETNYFFLELLTQIVKDFPNCTIKVKPTAYHNIKQLILSQSQLLAMSYRCEINGQSLFSAEEEAGLSFTPLFSCRMVIYVPRSYPIAVYKTISLKSLLDYPIILYQNKHDPISLLQLILLHYGTPANLITYPSSPLCQNMVNAGNGIGLTLLPDFHSINLPISSQVVQLTVRDDIKITCGLLRSEGTPFDDIRHLADYIINFANTL